MVFTSDGRRNKEIDTRIGKANAVLRAIYRSVVTNGSFQTPQSRQFLNRSLFFPIFTCGHESSWVMTERILSQVQQVEMGILRRVHGVTLLEKVRSCEIRKALNVEPLLRIEIPK